MKTKLIIVSLIALAGLAIVAVSYSSLAGCATSAHASWSFVQAVGGIKVGDAQSVSNHTWIIPIECDVSGLTAVTTKPTTMNSGLVVKDVQIEVKQETMLIWVITCVVTDRFKESHWTKGLTLKGVQPGHYRVQYLNPDGSTAGIRSIELWQ